MKNEKYSIEGMTCTACALAIERQLNKTPGVISVAVNYATEQMQVTYEESDLDQQGIFTAVEDAGYKALSRNNDSGSTSANMDHQGPPPAVLHAAAMKQRLILSLLFTVPVFYLAMGPMMGLPVPSFFSGEQNMMFMALTQLLLTIPVMIIGNQFYHTGYKTLLKRAPNMDSLIAVGTTGAFVYGIYVIYKLAYGYAYNLPEVVHHFSHDLYFESVAVIITLITLGKYLEAVAKAKTSNAILELLALAPDEATILVDEKEVTVPTNEVQSGQVIVVRPGAKVPVDGQIVVGSTTIDESMLTGESLPVDKTVGSAVTAGTLNLTGSIQFEATQVGADTTLAKIVQMVEDAQGTKAPIAKLADKISGVFVPMVLGIALITFIAWMIFGATFEFAFRAAISILVISCPCALGLATPTAIMVGTGQGAKYGTLIKSSEALEQLARLKTIVFDKTGTLTKGKVQITDILHGDNLDKFLSYTSSVEHHSEHPLSRAIVNYCDEHAILYKPADNFQNISGQGITGTVNGIRVAVGNEKLMRELGWFDDMLLADMSSLAASGKTPILVGYEDQVQGIIGLGDTIKDDSIQAIARLHRLGIETVMLTGDHEETAQAIGKQLGIDKIYAQVMPGEKGDIVASLKGDDHLVMMVGDGINDAVALTQADVGMAIGTGTDIAIESAVVVLMKDSLLDVATAIALSKATLRNIKQNLFWAFIYNIIGIPIAAGVLYHSTGIMLNPMIAAAAMSFSSVSVVTNALRLKTFKPDKFLGTEEKIPTTHEASAPFDGDLSSVTINNITLPTKIQNNKKENNIMTKTLTVEGMTCMHCVGRVKKTLEGFSGVTEVSVDLDSKLAVVNSDVELDNTALTEAIVDQGYEVANIEG